mgnify:CR=1 FL=1
MSEQSNFIYNVPSGCLSSLIGVFLAFLVCILLSLLLAGCKGKEYITERVTLSKPPNKWELDAVAGLDYNITSQRFTPYAGGELMYKPNRLQVGVRGGVQYDNTVQPFVGGVIKYRIH